MRTPGRFSKDQQAVIQRWSARLTHFTPGFFAKSAVLSPLAGRCAVILHGSTTQGVDDAFSDLDLWVLASDEQQRHVDSVAGTRFFSFDLDGKKGHFNIETTGEFIRRITNCEMETIAELRECHVLLDASGVANELVAKSKQPMSESVRRAWFCHHYVEMRGFHRNCDNPIERGDALATLQALVPTLNHALRAVMVLDREPYPYIKWLGQAAGRTPTGRQLLPAVNDMLDLLGTDVLRCAGPEPAHPLGMKLREIRQILIESARQGGIDEPWLNRWWAHMPQAAEGIRSVRWQ